MNASDCNFDELWQQKQLWEHRRADRELAFNGKNMSPIDLVWSNLKEERMSTFAENYIVDDIILDSENRGGRNIACNLAKLEKARRLAKHKRGEAKKQSDQARKERLEAGNQRDHEAATAWSQTLMVVATLIATITFAAAYVIPCGYDGNQGRDQGMAALARATAFQAFVITNTIAIICSVISMLLLCITGLWYAYRGGDDIDDDRAFARNAGAVILILVAMFAMMVAFISATFVMLAHSIALALSTCIIACIPFIAYILELNKFISRALQTSALYICNFIEKTHFFFTLLEL
ncbi:hypothetical protein RHMOL_Rhmol04G0313700 [Rhododendron molle]|uniref:Uncharacterized protein n=1 Tax=Rhododendron molle TaxID=49168 RepID=A0ACC0P8P6_RHOML|nr:hypothetical protein RHMOL_Rhmol04G0313700 [Rhododendron molle]